MIEVKNGICKLKGSENEIFNDVVNTVGSFCEGLAEAKGVSVTSMLYCVVAGTLEKIDGVSLDSLIGALKRIETHKGDANED